MEEKTIQNSISAIVKFIEKDCIIDAIKTLETSRLIEAFIKPNFPKNEKLNDLIIDIIEYLGHPDLHFTTKEIILKRFNEFYNK